LLKPAALPAQDFAALEIEWKNIAADFEIARVSLWPTAIFSPEVLVFRTALNNYRVAALRSADFGKGKAQARAFHRRTSFGDIHRLSAVSERRLPVSQKDREHGAPPIFVFRVFRCCRH
jgi:hypothetical protein